MSLGKSIGCCAESLETLQEITGMSTNQEV